MLERITINGYRLLRRVEAPLRPLTVLIGRNNTGKSSFLQALLALATGNLSGVPLGWKTDAASGVELAGQAVYGGKRVHARFTHQPPRETLADFNSNLREVAVFELPRAGPPMAGIVVPDAAGPPPLSANGDGVASLLDHLQRRDRPRFDRLVAAARSRIPGLEDIVLTAMTSESRSVILRIEGGFELRADAASAGVRVMLFFLALTHHPRPPQLILVEEPETGLHPAALGDVVALLRSLTVAERGADRAQVVLSTHSPYLLDHIDPSGDQVLVFRRSPEGEAMVEAADETRLKVFLDEEFKLGEVWFNQGEEGLIRKDS